MGKRGVPPSSPVGRILLKTRIEDRGYDTACWIFTGHVQNAGYGQISDVGTGKRMTRTCHRVMWESVNGSIPKGLDIDHLCHQKTCCNPQHLEAVTRSENLRRRKPFAWRWYRRPVTKEQ